MDTFKPVIEKASFKRASIKPEIERASFAAAIAPRRLPHLMRLPQILAEIPVSPATWWAGCKTGRYPKPVKLGPKTTAWFGADIEQLLDDLRQRSDLKT